MEHHIPTQIPTEGQMQELAEFYRVFSDCTRVKLLYALLSGEKRVLARFRMRLELASRQPRISFVF